MLFSQSEKSSASSSKSFHTFSLLPLWSTSPRRQRWRRCLRKLSMEADFSFWRPITLSWRGQQAARQQLLGQAECVQAFSWETQGREHLFPPGRKGAEPHLCFWARARGWGRGRVLRCSRAMFFPLPGTPVTGI